MNRTRLIRGISISAVLIILIISGLVLFREREKRQARVDQRFPLQGLGYCTSNQITPCVVSFSQDSDENMFVNFVTEGAFYPDFYLMIKTDKSDHIYVCRKVSKFATSVYCTGKVLPIGQVFQFLIFSLNEDVLLAQGNLSIIGMGLATPEIYVSPTPGPSYPSYPSSRPE